MTRLTLLLRGGGGGSVCAVLRCVCLCLCGAYMPVHSLRLCLGAVVSVVLGAAAVPWQQGCSSTRRPLELKRLFFLDLSMVDRRLHDDLRKIYLHLKAPRFDLHRQQRCSSTRRPLEMSPRERETGESRLRSRRRAVAAAGVLLHECSSASLRRKLARALRLDLRESSTVQGEFGQFSQWSNGQ
jgi:hypothetical protein